MQRQPRTQQSSTRESKHMAPTTRPDAEHRAHSDGPDEPSPDAPATIESDARLAQPGDHASDSDAIDAGLGSEKLARLSYARRSQRHELGGESEARSSYGAVTGRDRWSSRRSGNDD
jgi:hypothetical protein